MFIIESIAVNRSKSNFTSLAVYINDLDINKQYDNFYFKIDHDWINIPFVNNNKTTDSVIVLNLQPYTKYNISAQYYLNNECFNISSTTFVTYPSKEELSIPDNLKKDKTIRNAPQIGESQKVSAFLQQRGD